MTSTESFFAGIGIVCCTLGAGYLLLRVLIWAWELALKIDGYRAAVDFEKDLERARQENVALRAELEVAKSGAPYRAPGAIK